jgi:hypothetical protein
MKKAIALLCLLTALIGASVSADAAPAFSKALFQKGKDAVNLIAYGEYEKAIGKLGFSGGAPASSDFEAFVEEELSDIFTGAVQTDVAVAYYINDRWVLAIPINEPQYDSVQVFLLSSTDGKSFDAYRASSWKNVQANAGKANDVVWNIAYEPELPAIFVDE